MTVTHKIVQKGDPALSAISHEVPFGDDVSGLIAGMWQAMRDSKIEAAGLAANQIGILRRVIVINAAGLVIEIINPEIIKRSLGKVKSTERCLSFPGKKVVMVRSKQITVTGFDCNWNPIKLKLRGLAGMCVQHEVDHLNGVTIA